MQANCEQGETTLIHGKKKNYACLPFFSDDVSVTKIYKWLTSHGPITFVDKVDHKKFMIICRDSKTARRIIKMKGPAKNGMQISCKYLIPLAIIV